MSTGTGPSGSAVSGQSTETRLATAIFTPKRDNSFIAATALRLFRGDTALVRGKKRRDTLLIVLFDENLEDGCAGFNRVVRQNLRVLYGDFVSAKRVALLPFADTVEGLTGSLFEQFFAPYFREAYRPVRQGDCLTIKNGSRLCEFKIVEVDPPEYGIVAQDTIIHCEGEPLEREDPSAVQQNDSGYDDIGGYREQLAQLRELVELPLRHPMLFRALGVSPPRGVLLHGPPGTGKSLMSRAVANETGAYFYKIQGAELFSMDKPLATLQKVFDDAEKHSPAIILIEDVDFVAPTRDKPGNDNERATLAQFLAAMVRLESIAGVIVVATSNNPERIDRGLRRFGRLGVEVELGTPDLNERLEILKIHTKSMKLSDNVDLRQIAAQTHGYVGSDIAGLCFIASMQQIRRKMPQINLQDEGLVDAAVLDSLSITMQDFDFGLDTMIKRRFEE